MTALQSDRSSERKMCRMTGVQSDKCAGRLLYALVVKIAERHSWASQLGIFSPGVLPERILEHVSS
ncbi:Mediator of plasmid stability [Sesbania bispinosa]|nr:Mediator of plasmid stability [Sesbania bispinosa]